MSTTVVTETNWHSTYYKRGKLILTTDLPNIEERKFDNEEDCINAMLEDIVVILDDSGFETEDYKNMIILNNDFKSFDLKKGYSRLNSHKNVAIMCDGRSWYVEVQHIHSTYDCNRDALFLLGVGDTVSAALKDSIAMILLNVHGRDKSIADMFRDFKLLDGDFIKRFKQWKETEEYIKG